MVRSRSMDCWVQGNSPVGQQGLTSRLPRVSKLVSGSRESAGGRRVKKGTLREVAAAMFANLNHVAIVSDNYANLSIWYRAMFGLEVKTNARFEAFAMSIGDGYVGMNVNPRMAGRQAGFDHFGIQVEDVETVRERVARK